MMKIVKKKNEYGDKSNNINDHTTNNSPRILMDNALLKQILDFLITMFKQNF